VDNASASVANTHVVVVDDLWAELHIAKPMGNPTSEWLVPLKVSRPWKLSVMVIAATLLLHVLFGWVMFTRYGGVVVTPHTSRTSPAPSDHATSGGTEITLLLLSEEQAAATATSTKVITRPTTDRSKENAELESEHHSARAVGSAIGGRVSAISGDGKTPRTPQGIYLDQIRARIDRARGSTGLKMAVGRCDVLIHQDQQGQVQKVEFGRCLAAADWKDNLVQAIRYASPLPAPPDESVFSEQVQLQF
jgi:hypothetical protein